MHFLAAGVDAPHCISEVSSCSVTAPVHKLSTGSECQSNVRILGVGSSTSCMSTVNAQMTHSGVMDPTPHTTTGPQGAHQELAEARLEIAGLRAALARATSAATTATATPKPLLSRVELLPEEHHHRDATSAGDAHDAHDDGDDDTITAPMATDAAGLRRQLLRARRHAHDLDREYFELFERNLQLVDELHRVGGGGGGDANKDEEEELRTRVAELEKQLAAARRMHSM